MRIYNLNTYKVPYIYSVKMFVSTITKRTLNYLKQLPNVGRHDYYVMIHSFWYLYITVYMIGLFFIF